MLRWTLPLFLLFSLACSGLIPAGDPLAALQGAHPDGVELYSTLYQDRELRYSRPLTPEAAAGRYRYRVTWSGGAITEYALLRPSGQQAYAVQVERTPEGGSRYRTRSAYGVEVSTEEYGADNTYRQVLRSGVSTIRGCSRLGVERDETGRMIAETCLDPDGRTIIDENGCQVVRYAWSAEGDLEEFSCFDDAQRPVADAYGIHRARIQVDAHGQEIERSFFGADGARVARATDGCSGWRTIRDEKGLAVQELCLNSGNLPASVTNSSHAGWKDTLDENGCIQARKYITVSGSPATKGGIAEERYQYDNRCGLLAEEHLDNTGERKQPGAWQAARATYELNGEGLIVRQQCWGDGGKDADCTFLKTDGKSGSVHRFSYDERGRRVESRAFHADGRPALHASGTYPHIRRWIYGEDGMVSAEAFGGFEGEPAMGLQVWRFEYSRDALGAQISTRFLGQSGSLIPSPSILCAEIRTQYDEKHRLSMMECLGVRGERVKSRVSRNGVSWDSAAAVDLERDEQGTVVANRFYAANGKQLRRVSCADLATPCYR